ncbi:T9SS type A sorting domain-containing protein [Bacteroidota bacterium]
MKKFLLFILLLSTLYSSGQNWQPVNPLYRYNYQHDTASFVSNTIRVLTTDVINNDTVYHLNTIITPCDTCHSDLGGISNPNGDAFALRNQPQFLQRKMRKLNNDVYYFYDTLKITIPSYTQLNDVWLFDSVLNLSATVIQMEQEMLFGTLDSVKIILLSNNDTLILSKNFGIILFPDFFLPNAYYRLVGVEGPDVGIVLPDFWDIYSYDSGDVFQYKHYLGGSSFGYIYYQTVKFAITSRQEYSDSIVFSGLEIVNSLRYGPWYVPPVYDYDTIVHNISVSVIDSVNHPANLYTGEYTVYNKYIMGELLQNRIIYDSNNRIVKNFGCFSPFNCPKQFRVVPGYMDILYATPPLYSEGIEYTQDLGLSSYDYFAFEYSDDIWLMGYVIDGDTVGTITPDDVMLSTNNRINDDGGLFIVYPIPANNQINIVFNFLLEKLAILELYDISGRLILKKDLSAGTEFYILDVKEISDGIYFINLKGNQRNYIKKIIIRK